MQQPQRKAGRTQSRRGAALVEAAITLSAFFTLVLGMLDLGIGVLHYNTIAYAARTGARAAIVHGSLAPTAAGFGGPWNNSTADTAITALITPLLKAVGIPDSDILASVTVVHTDGTDPEPSSPDMNDPVDVAADPADTVTVTVSVPYQPLMAFIFGTGTITLTATSTMSIAH